MKYNSIGEQLIAKAKEIDPSYKSDKFNDMSEALDIILKNSGGIPTTSINSQTYQLDTSSLTTKDQYILASADDGAGSISYIPLQTYFFNDGYFNKEIKMQTTSSDFRLSLTNVSFQSYNNYTLNAKGTNVDFTSTLDSANTWTKLGDIKYITIEEQNLLTEESSHKYLEISGGGSSIFDITPYLTSETSMSIEGYNALREFVTSNKGGMIKMAANDSDAFYYNCMSISLHDIMFSLTGSTGIALQTQLLIINEDGNVQKVETIIKNIPSLPSDASIKTYTLQTVNGVLTWTDAIGDINTILDNINGEVI